MNKPIILALLAALLAEPALAGSFRLSSPDFRAGGTLDKAQAYDGYGCAGGNVSPALNWSGAPAGTRSFAITVFDPDAPTGKGWWHWLVIDLPADSTGLARGAGSAGGSLPAGAVATRSDFGASAYGGPCPPAGDHPHHYVFTVYALGSERLPLGADASATEVSAYLQHNRLDEAVVTARYGR